MTEPRTNLLPEGLQPNGNYVVNIHANAQLQWAGKLTIQHPILGTMFTISVEAYTIEDEIVEFGVDILDHFNDQLVYENSFNVD